MLNFPHNFKMKKCLLCRYSPYMQHELKQLNSHVTKPWQSNKKLPINIHKFGYILWQILLSTQNVNPDEDTTSSTTSDDVVSYNPNTYIQQKQQNMKLKKWHPKAYLLLKTINVATTWARKKTARAHNWSFELWLMKGTRRSICWADDLHQLYISYDSCQVF